MSRTFQSTIRVLTSYSMEALLPPVPGPDAHHVTKLTNITLIMCGKSLNYLGVQNLMLVFPLTTCVTLETSVYLLAPGFFTYLTQNRLTVCFH